jgi:glycosyltransferase involved in cell wall biosynthesis
VAEILFVAYLFPPVGGAGVQRALSFARYLPDEGFLPTVLAGPASADDHWTPEDATLTAAIPAGVRVHRVDGDPPVPGPWRRRLERWRLVPGTFDDWWIRSAVALGERVADNERLILATMSPFSSADVAARLSTRLGIPWVADLRDPWALDEMQVYPSALHRFFERRRMERALSSAALIVMNTPEAASALTKELPRLRAKDVVAITNGFDRSDFEGPFDSDGSGDTFRIVHTGYLHADAGVRGAQRLLGGARAGVDVLTRSHAVLLEALGRWCSSRPQIESRIELVLAGKTTDRDRSLVAASPIARVVRFTGYLSHAESVRLVRGADLLFLPMHQLGVGEQSRIVPGKTYEYMASGRPILAAVPDGDAKEFLRSCGTALVCDPDDVHEMVQLLDRAFTRWEAGLPMGVSDERYVSRFERRRLARALAAALARVAARSTGNAPMGGAVGPVSPIEGVDAERVSRAVSG